MTDSVNWGGSGQEALPDDEAPRAGVGRRRRGRPRKVPGDVAPPANKKQRQTKLQRNVLPARENITILAGAKPIAGRGSALVTGHAGAKLIGCTRIGSCGTRTMLMSLYSDKYKDISIAELPSNRLNNR